MAVCAGKRGFLEAVGTEVSSAGSAFLTLARVVGMVVCVEGTIALMTIIRCIQEPGERGDAIVMIPRLEQNQDMVLIHLCGSGEQGFLHLVAEDLQLKRGRQGGEICLKYLELVPPARTFWNSRHQV